MGISRDSLHKKRSTGGCKSLYKKKRKNCLARPKTLTKIGAKRIRTVRTRGGHEKKRALRLDSGNFSWGSESITRKARITDVVYHPSDNEFIRTKTVVKHSIVQIDANPFKNWYTSYYNTAIGKKKDADANVNKGPVSKNALAKFEQRQKHAKLESSVEDQFTFGKLYACISSRPGQCGRADGYILEGKELEFYLKKIKSKKNK